MTVQPMEEWFGWEWEVVKLNETYEVVVTCD